MCYHTWHLIRFHKKKRDENWPIVDNVLTLWWAFVSCSQSHHLTDLRGGNTAGGIADTGLACFYAGLAALALLAHVFPTAEKDRAILCRWREREQMSGSPGCRLLLVPCGPIVALLPDQIICNAAAPLTMAHL